MMNYAGKNSVLDAATRPDDGYIGEVRATAIGSRKIHDKPTQIDIPHAFKRLCIFVDDRYRLRLRQGHNA